MATKKPPQQTAADQHATTDAGTDTSSVPGADTPESEPLALQTDEQALTLGHATSASDAPTSAPAALGQSDTEPAKQPIKQAVPQHIGGSSLKHLARTGAIAAPQSSPASRLVADEDTMELHTREAMLLYLGKAPGEEVRFGLPGARHAASALRQIFGLTARDNPYADAVLVDIDARVERIRKLISRTRQAEIAKLDELKAMGLSYSIIRAQQTQTVSLGYHSPYGYMMSNTIVAFDECVRVLKSAERRDLMTKQDQHKALYEIKHAIRSVFELSIKAQRVLLSEQMKTMSRSDFMPQCADPLAAKRVEAARKILGPLDEAIYNGQKSPRHSMRKDRLSNADQRVLDEVAQSLSAGSDTPDGLV